MSSLRNDHHLCRRPGTQRCVVGSRLTAAITLLSQRNQPTANVIGPTFSWRAVRPSRGADLRALTREASVCSTQASSLTGFIFALKTTRASKNGSREKLSQDGGQDKEDQRKSS
ncbi:hypothetical protein PSHT_04596 [Puccinia striiformis]|uniref:Uncharacterized protein n=1 Tax=Puccinia striiformis TaxID=27350 RepID=A0A2S4WCH7_9BASI|nr:hypothetical protein PSHT_04596 [Puccinia striiformis]